MTVVFFFRFRSQTFSLFVFIVGLQRRRDKYSSLIRTVSYHCCVYSALNGILLFRYVWVVFEYLFVLVINAECSLRHRNRTIPSTNQSRSIKFKCRRLRIFTIIHEVAQLRLKSKRTSIMIYNWSNHLITPNR